MFSGISLDAVYVCALDTLHSTLPEMARFTEKAVRMENQVTRLTTTAVLGVGLEKKTVTA